MVLIPLLAAVLANSFSSSLAAIAKNGAAGALYFFNNEPTGNQVIALDIAFNGTISYASATHTGGKGGHGIPITVADPLYSVGSIQVSGEHLFVVNPGSDTVSMFAIDPKRPTRLTPVGNPISSQGEFPMSLAVSPSGNHVCVLNGGANSGLQCFSANPVKGLSVLPNTHRSIFINETTPPSGPSNAMSQVIFMPNGKKLLVSHKGPVPGRDSGGATPGFIKAWDVLPSGALSETEETTLGGGRPFSMTPIKDTSNKAILNTDPQQGYAVYDFSKGYGANATITPFAIEGQVANCWSEYSSISDSYFLSDNNTGIVNEVRLDENLQGSFVQSFKFTAATIDEAIATVQGKDYLYVLEGLTDSIHVLSLLPDGKSHPIQAYDYAAPASLDGVVTHGVNVQGMAAFIK